jgi:hypothetical protein
VIIAAVSIGEGRGQTAEVVDHAVDAGERENPEHGGAGNDEDHLGTLGLGSLVRGDDSMKARHVTEPGPGHIDYEHCVVSRGRVEQGRPQSCGVCDVDLLGSSHHWYALGYLYREPVVRHLRTSCRCRQLLLVTWCLAAHDPVTYL